MMSFKAPLLLLLSGCFSIAVESSEILYSIDEELPVGTTIGNVAADSGSGDGLSQDARSGLRFKFLSNPALDITIDENNGDIRTAGRVDRDATCRGDPDTVCQVRVSVAVHPVAYFRIIKVVISVVDINDNSPSFQPSHLVHEMIESSSVDSSFAVPSARDADSTANSVRGYELTDPDGFFVLNITRKLDGSPEVRLVLAKSLDREAREEHRVTVTAYDAGDPPRSGSLDVTVVVLDSNDNAPVFEYSSYEVTVKENVPLGTTVAKVTARDRDVDLNGQVMYFFSASTRTAFGSVFQVNNVTGEIYVAGSVDYERTPTYHLIVSAVDRGHDPVPSETNVIVTVEDVNDNPPKITVNTLFASDANVSGASEGSPVGTFVGHVIVHDPDRGHNGVFNCSLSDATSFRLDRVLNSEYHVITVTELDFEQTAEYSLTVSCSDHGRPSLTSDKDLTISVLDVNDNSPVCSPDVYLAELFENNYNGKVVVQVNCTDDDSAQYSITSYRVSDEGSRRFSVDNITGTVVATSSLDREDVSEHRFLVFAVDGGIPPRTGSASIVVTVLDVNDEKPVMSVASYAFEVEENLPAGSVVGELAARDLDSHPFDHFRFSLTSGGTPSDAFFVNRMTGKITTTCVLDREEQDIYVMTSIVSDVISPSMTSSALVTVVVLDVNDHSPVFTFPTPGNNTVQVSGTALEGQTLARLRAHDLDDRLNGEVTYSLVKGDDQKVFTLDPVTGALKAGVDFERVGNNTFSLVVGATDRGADPRRTLAFLNVVVSRGSPRDAFVSFDGSGLVPVLLVGGVSAVAVSVLLVAILVVGCRQRTRKKNNVSRRYNCPGQEDEDDDEEEDEEEVLKRKQLTTTLVGGEWDAVQEVVLAGIATGTVPSADVDQPTINSVVQVRLENGKTVSHCYATAQEKQLCSGNLKPPEYYECYSDYSSAESLAAATLTRRGGRHVICDVCEEEAATPSSFAGHRTKQQTIPGDPNAIGTRATNILANTLRCRLRSCDVDLSTDVVSGDSGRASNFNEDTRDNASPSTLLMPKRRLEAAGSPYPGICSRTQCPYFQIPCSKCPPSTTTLPNVICTTSALGPCYNVVPPSFQRSRPAQDGLPTIAPGSDMVSSGTAYEVTPSSSSYSSSSSSFQRFYFRPVQETGRKFADNHSTTASGSPINMTGSLSDSCHQQTIVRFNR